MGQWPHRKSLESQRLCTFRLIEETGDFALWATLEHNGRTPRPSITLQKRRVSLAKNLLNVLLLEDADAEHAACRIDRQRDDSQCNQRDNRMLGHQILQTGEQFRHGELRGNVDKAPDEHERATDLARTFRAAELYRKRLSNSNKN